MGASHEAPSKQLKTAGRSPARKSALTEGAKAPAFRLPRDGGGTVSLSDFSGKKLALFFYPRADTPGCTKEAIDFTRLAKSFAEYQTAILGVSADPPRTQEAFRNKHRLAIPLISDETHEMLEAYGVWGEKSMYGKTFQGILRTTVLIGTDGRIVKIWRNVRVDGHADAVLAAAQAI
jgi:peroxiredoxin Q/BCP